MARIASLTFRISTDTRIDAQYMGDFRVNGKQNVRRGDAQGMEKFLADVRKAASQHKTVELVVADETGELSHLLTA